MNIIITMAGASSRFFNKGYKLPKYMLTLEDITVFEKSIIRYKDFFKISDFTFVILENFETKNFVAEKCNKLGILNFKIIVLEYITEGQAETVYFALKRMRIENDESILIGNIDTFSEAYFFSNKELNYDGFLEVFTGEGDHWSFAKTKKQSSLVIETAEKKRISKYCSSGLYYFKKVSDYIFAFETAKSKSLKEKNEYYIAPLYNSLIEKGLKIHIVERDINDFQFCGTPEEYEYLTKKL